MNFIQKPSPNFSNRAKRQAPSYIMLHYTGMKTAEDALARLSERKSKVSAHLTIDEDGTVYEHVPLEMRAWHAGAGCWREITDMNSDSIGIELVNPGHEHGYRPFPPAQIDKLIEVLTELKNRFDIPARNIIGHSDYAPERKEDPGELFPWARLATEGLGVWPNVLPEDIDRAATWDLDTYVSGVKAYGYHDDVGYEYILRAFERHFVPELILGTSQDDSLGRVRVIALLRQELEE